MPRTESYDLSDAEKRDLIQLIQQGKCLPEKYRFILFEDKREVELVWNGKTRDVCTTVLPFQTLEHIDEPRKEKADEAQFAFDTRGRQLKGWTNKLIWGDNKLILSSLKSGALRKQIEDAGGLKLIYIDPPFDVGADFSMDIEIGGETFHKEPNLLEQIAYRDTWGRGADSFIAMLYERFVLMRDLLHEKGCIYVHMGPHVAHAVEAILREVFGATGVSAAITWKRVTAHGDSQRWGITHDVILWRTRSEDFTWNPQYEPYSDEYIARFSERTHDGRAYQLDNITSPNPRPNMMYEWRGCPPPAMGWRYEPATMEKLFAEGRIELPKKPGGRPRLRRFLDESKGVPVGSVWADIAPVNSQAKEDTGYATQKCESLLTRIMKASSNEGDLVADFFCGSGTTAAVAEKLGRKWIATDLGKFAIHTTRKRLIQVQRERKAAGEPFRPFEVLNLGRYERAIYLSVPGRLTAKQKEDALAQKEHEFRELILRAYKAQPLDGDGFFHGKNAARLVIVGPINLPVGRLFVEEVILECRKRRVTRVDILAFEFEMGLFPAALDEAKSKGIDIVPKYIPAEVFDKRAVDKGQVVFHDISFIEATPRYDTADKLSLRIELTEFSVYYTQSTIEAVTAELKANKSEVVCEQGRLIKISKDKNGVVSREVLTKHWTDWVDYWAVDFDYTSKQEVVTVTASPEQAELFGLSVHQGEFAFEERWTGNYIFENEWQSFRTRQTRNLELTSATHTYVKPGRYTIAVKVIDIFGNDTMTLVPVTMG